MGSSRMLNSAAINMSKMQNDEPWQLATRRGFKKGNAKEPSLNTNTPTNDYRNAANKHNIPIIVATAAKRTPLKTSLKKIKANSLSSQESSICDEAIKEAAEVMRMGRDKFKASIILSSTKSSDSSVEIVACIQVSHISETDQLCGGCIPTREKSTEVEDRAIVRQAGLNAEHAMKSHLVTKLSESEREKFMLLGEVNDGIVRLVKTDKIIGKLREEGNLEYACTTGGFVGEADMIACIECIRVMKRQVTDLAHPTHDALGRPYTYGRCVAAMDRLDLGRSTAVGKVVLDRLHGQRRQGEFVLQRLDDA